MPEQEDSIEILSYYIIIALSFAIMYTYSYGLEITRIVIEVLEISGKRHQDYVKERAWHPYIYLSASFLLSLIAMPFFAKEIILMNKWDLVEYAAGEILSNSYSLNKK